LAELLRLENIGYVYEDSYPALKGVSAALGAGERIAVLGSNGAGKSTFFLCCNGVLRPQSGKIFLKGREVTDSKKDVTLLRQTVGLVFQEPDSQIIAPTVKAEVSFGPLNLRLPHGEVRERVAESLGLTNLSGYEDRAPHYLSGGEKKSVSIADILAMRPDMILLDEPTASLDPENVGQLEGLLETLSASGVSVVVSTHDAGFAYRFAERAIVFCEGEIIADGPIDEVFRSEETLLRAGLKKPLTLAARDVLESHFPNGLPDEIKELLCLKSR
jgi:cobalt/nickel transport system ATP-binding protein